MNWISRIQNLRKEMNLQVSDRIRVRVVAAQDLLDALESGRERVCSETLADELVFVPAADGATLDGDLNGKPCGVEVLKA